MPKEAPVQTNQLIDIDIHGVTANAEGVGRYLGFTIFVPQTLPGDKVVAKVISVKNNYGRALLETVTKPSEDRVKPPCIYYNRCGGCQLMHASYKAQLGYKQDQVQSALKHIGNFDHLTVLPIIGMEDPFHYRNKAHFPVGIENDLAIAGCYQKRSHDIVDIERCAIQHDEINRVLQLTKKLINELKINIYDEATHYGLLRNILVKHAFTTGQTMIVFITNGSHLPQEEYIAARLMETFEKIVSVQLNENNKPGNKLMGTHTRVIAGRDHIIEEMGSLQFKISASSFYQVNPIQTIRLYSKALEFADLGAEEIVFDLYCGVGTISLFMADKAKTVTGIDIVSEAIGDAEHNARLNKINNCNFLSGTVEKILPGLIDEGKRPEVCIIDPPRTGCKEELLKTLITAAPEKLVYISCNPATLARDLKYLCNNSFIVEKVQPVDMFPHTSHVESVVLMSRTEK